jgi:hypothetical protein
LRSRGVAAGSNRQQAVDAARKQRSYGRVDVGHASFLSSLGKKQKLETKTRNWPVRKRSAPGQREATTQKQRAQKSSRQTAAGVRAPAAGLSHRAP